MTLTPQPRSVRNNNPGNLRKGVKWDGLAPEQTDPDFCVFVDPEHGFRALSIDLHTKWKLDGLDTITAIISKYAPPSENDTQAYIDAVSRMVGEDPDTVLNLDEPAMLSSMCRAIAVHELGGWFFSTEDLAGGVKLAMDLIDPVSFG